MWVQLLSTQQFEKQGRMHVYHKGDWVDIGRQTAQLMIAKGEARVAITEANALAGDNNGVVVLNARHENAVYTDMLVKFGVKLSVTLSEEPAIIYSRNMLWDAGLILRPELISAGFNLLDKWDIVCPLWSYTELAVHLGTEEERKRTEAVVRDLRVPVYDIRLMFVKANETTRGLFQLWLKEMSNSNEPRLAFMRAFYQTKPLMLALPITWTQPKAYAESA